MKRWIIGLAAFAVIACIGLAGAQNVMENQGALWSIRSGGVLNVETGGALKFNSVDQTAALATAPAGVAAGYKIARGVTALDGSNPTSVDGVVHRDAQSDRRAEPLDLGGHRELLDRAARYVRLEADLGGLAEPDRLDRHRQRRLAVHRHLT